MNMIIINLSYINSTGNVTAQYFIGDGSFLTNVNESDTLDDVTTRGATTSNSVVFGDILPFTTLTYDLGSGASRWNWLYVHNISADNIEVLNDLEVTGDITATQINSNIINTSELYINGTLFLNGTLVIDGNATIDTVLENFTVTDGTYNVILSGTTIYSDTLYAPLLQLGGYSSSTGSYAVAIGLSSNATGTSSFALGNLAKSVGVESMALGSLSSANTRSAALGYWSSAEGDGSLALGELAWAVGDSSSAIGYQATSKGNYATAIGYGADADGLVSFAIGRTANASGDYSFAIGDNITVVGLNSFGVGHDGISTNPNTFTIHNLNVNITNGGNITTTGTGTFGNIIVENIETTGNFSGNQFYAQVCYHNHTPTEMTFEADVYYNITFNTENGYYLNGFTSDGTTTLTTLIPGLYDTSYSVIGDGQNNHIYIARIAVNNIGKSCSEIHRKMAAGGDIITMTGSSLIRLNVDDVITLQIADEGEAGTGNYYGMNLNLIRIGD